MTDQTGKKTGGRKPGIPNKRSLEAMEIAEAMGFNPIEVLIHWANGDWKALGYHAPDRVIAYSQGGDEVREDVIPPKLRLDALKDVSGYLFPKRKAIEHSGSLETTNKTLEEHLRELKQPQE